MEEKKELMTRSQVANYLKISLVALNDFIKKGLIPAHRLNTRVRYYENDVINFVNK